MRRKAVFFLALGSALLGPAAVQALQSTLALEGAHVSLSADLAAESPAGSGLLHDVSIDGGDGAYGLSFEARITRYVGIRFGGLWSSVPVSGRSVCPTAPCEFTRDQTRVIIGDVEWSVDDDSDLRMLFVEVPFVFQPTTNVDLFAGPTIAFVEVGDVASSGLEGLRVEVDAASPSYGFHLGGSVHFGGRRGPGRSEPAWTAGVIARWIPTELELSVSQPTLPVGSLLRGESDEDLVSIGVMVGRRFGRARR
jgi:hypothetical protein